MSITLPDKLINRIRENRLQAGLLEKERSNKNINGIKNGFGWCLSCHDTWDWKKHHLIWVKDYTDNNPGGAFPYCEECSNTISIDQKKELITRMVNQWIGDDPQNIDQLLEDEFKLHEAVESGL